MKTKSPQRKSSTCSFLAYHPQAREADEESTPSSVLHPPLQNSTSLVRVPDSLLYVQADLAIKRDRHQERDHKSVKIIREESLPDFYSFCRFFSCLCCSCFLPFSEKNLCTNWFTSPLSVRCHLICTKLLSNGGSCVQERTGAHTVPRETKLGFQYFVRQDFNKALADDVSSHQVHPVFLDC